MPKNRKRVIQKGAKSVAIRTKHKVGGRKSATGTRQMSTRDIQGRLGSARKRDVPALMNELQRRGNISIIAST